MTTKRNDVHSPSKIVPSEYEFVAHEFLKIEELGDAAFLIEERARIRSHMERTGGTYSKHEHGGVCMVCGNTTAIYTCLFYHRPTNSYVRVGTECSYKVGGSFGDDTFKTKIKDARKLQAGKRKAEAILSDLGLQKCWNLFVSQQTKEEGREEGIIRSVAAGLVKHGSLTEKQTNFLRKLLVDISTRKEREAADKLEHDTAANCPTGRVTIVGTVLGIRVDETDFGLVTKMLVKDDSGFKVWGTKISCADKGDRISFSGDVTPSKDDAKFGFFKRPTKGKILGKSTKEE